MMGDELNVTADVPASEREEIKTEAKELVEDVGDKSKELTREAFENEVIGNGCTLNNVKEGGRVDVGSSKCDNNLTISTKLSTDQLICKSPQNSPNPSIKSESKRDLPEKKRRDKIGCLHLELYLGVLQILFGLLMTVFGVFSITHHASLSQIGGGIWGGCLAISSGTVGVLTVARKCCPLKRRAQHIARTVSLALSLISLAVSQLVLVLATTGLTRDVEKNNPEPEAIDEVTTQYINEDSALQKAILSNVGLIFASALQFICSAMACYKCARAVCPCFKREEERIRYNYYNNSKQAFINSWLGKHNSPSFYVVAASSPLGKGNKFSAGLSMAPIYTLPTSQVVQQSSLIGYPLIPAPLGPVPSPIIRHNAKEYIYSRPKYHHAKERLALTERQKKRQRERSRSKSKEKVVTTEDVAKTYTGLDRTIAEEFIDICESRNNSLCSSNSSCQSCCQCSSQNVCNLCSNGSSDDNSRDYLVNK